MNRNIVFGMIVLLSLTLAACEEKGPAEKVGESVDQAVEDIQDGGRDLGNAIEDACEDVKEGAGAEDSDC